MYSDCTVLYIDTRRRQSRGHSFSAIRYIRSTNISGRSGNLPSDLLGNSTMIECLIMGRCPNARKFVPNEMALPFVSTKWRKFAGMTRTSPAVTCNRKHPSSSWSMFPKNVGLKVKVHRSCFSNFLTSIEVNQKKV